MSFDEQPDPDPHGECAAEIARLTAALRDIEMFACYASEENIDSREAVLLEIGNRARKALAPKEPTTRIYRRTSPTPSAGSPRQGRR